MLRRLKFFTTDSAGKRNKRVFPSSAHHPTKYPSYSHQQTNCTNQHIQKGTKHCRAPSQNQWSCWTIKAILHAKPWYHILETTAAAAAPYKSHDTTQHQEVSVARRRLLYPQVDACCLRIIIGKIASWRRFWKMIEAVTNRENCCHSISPHLAHCAPSRCVRSLSTGFENS